MCAQMDATSAFASLRRPSRATDRPARRHLLAAVASRLLFAALLLVLLPAATPAIAKDEATYVTSGELLERALGTLFDQIGLRPKVSMVLVEPALITVLTQGATEPHHTDEWTISRFEYLWFDSDSVSGPAPHQSEGVVPEAENSFFDLDEVGIGRLDEMVGRAIDFAKLEDRPSVVSLRIARKIQMVPERAYGEVEWQIVLSSGRENATVHLDVAGNVTGADLSGTLRAQRFDMFTQDDWPAKEVQTQLAAAIGDGAIVHEISISRTEIGVRAALPTSHDLLRDYSWDFSGIHHSSLEIANPLASGPGPYQPFALSEARLTALPAVKLAARRAFSSESAQITAIDARKPAPATGKPAVRWRVAFQEADGARGHVDLDADGKVLEAVKPVAADK
jgi:hypothetical protein